MINWIIYKELIKYSDALEKMQNAYQDLLMNQGPETIFLLEHENVITKGASAKDSELLSPTIPVINTNRGGKFTYHGPGQKIMYLVLNLKNWHLDVKQYVHNLEELIILCLQDLDINAFRKNGLIGVWVHHNNEDKKIASIGVTIKKFITSHGLSINIAPDLRFFKEIIPCGITNYSITSLEEIGTKCSSDDINELIKKNFNKVFIS